MCVFRGNNVRVWRLKQERLLCDSFWNTLRSGAYACERGPSARSYGSKLKAHRLFRGWGAHPQNAYKCCILPSPLRQYLSFVLQRTALFVLLSRVRDRGKERERELFAFNSASIKLHERKAIQRKTTWTVWMCQIWQTTLNTTAYFKWLCVSVITPPPWVLGPVHCTVLNTAEMIFQIF